MRRYLGFHEYTNSFVLSHNKLQRELTIVRVSNQPRGGEGVLPALISECIARGRLGVLPMLISECIARGRLGVLPVLV